MTEGEKLEGERLGQEHTTQAVTSPRQYTKGEEAASVGSYTNHCAHRGSVEVEVRITGCHGVLLLRRQRYSNRRVPSLYPHQASTQSLFPKHGPTFNSYHPRAMGLTMGVERVNTCTGLVPTLTPTVPGLWDWRGLIHVLA